MQIPNEFRGNESGVHGPMPTIWYGVDAVDGDAYPWLQACSGSIYILRDLTNKDTYTYQKLDEQGVDTDWSPLGGVSVIQETVGFSDFTDGTGTDGTYTLTNGTLPIGAIVLGIAVVAVTAFSGDTTCTMTVGDGSDVDRYHTGTPSIFASADAVDFGVPSGTTSHSAAKSIVLTATAGSDWGLVSTAAKLTIRVFYIK